VSTTDSALSDDRDGPRDGKQTCQAEIEPSDLWLGVQGGIGTIGQTYVRSDATGRKRLGQAYNELAALGPDGLLHLASVAVLAVTHPDS